MKTINSKGGGPKRIFRFWFPVVLKERLDAECRRTGMNMSEVVRRAIIDHLERREADAGASGQQRSRGRA